MDFEESLKTVKPFESRRDFTNHVPRDGISLRFLLNHLSGVPSIKTMYNLEAYVLDVTRPQHCSFTELLANHATYQKCVVDTAEYFVSFAYSTAFEVILDALEKYRKKVEAEDIFVWISIFSINQHFGRTEGEEAAVVYPKGWFKNAFERCIPEIGNVLFVMHPLSDPVALKRLWCIYELYLTVLFSDCTLDVCLSTEDENLFINNLVKDSRSILEYINSVDAKSAESSNPKQEEKLRNRIELIDGKYETINSQVRDKLRLWFVHAAHSYIDSNKEKYQEDKKNFVILLKVVGKLEIELGRFAEAEETLNLALYEASELHGTQHPDTAGVMLNLAEVLKALARPEEAEPLCREALKINELFYGKHDLMVAASLNNYAHLLRELGRGKEAIPLYQRALAIFEEINGETHASIATVLNNLGVLLKKEGRIGEAIQMYQRALRIRRNLLGNDHPAIAGSLINLGSLYKGMGMFNDAEPLFREALRIDTQANGLYHPDVALDLSHLATLLQNMGRSEEAAKCARQSYDIAVAVLGESHPDTQNYKSICTWLGLHV